MRYLTYINTLCALYVLSLVIDQVQEEIDQILAGREPGSEDRKNLPYTDAVIHEIQRLANIVLMNLPHMTSCDVSFNGYFIKKVGPAILLM